MGRSGQPPEWSPATAVGAGADEGRPRLADRSAPAVRPELQHDRGGPRRNTEGFGKFCVDFWQVCPFDLFQRDRELSGFASNIGTVIAGTPNHLEIWNEARWNANLEAMQADLLVPESLMERIG